MDADHSCRTCSYFVMTIAAQAPRVTDVGRCHRYPPVWVPNADGMLRDVEFTPVQIDQWCGEWRPLGVAALAM